MKKAAISTTLWVRATVASNCSIKGDVWVLTVLTHTLEQSLKQSLLVKSITGC
jgi:hypothetical protein